MIKYQIINRKNFNQINALIIDVRLFEKASYNDLIILASKIKEKHPGEYRRMFIFYFLPGMSPDNDNDAYASSHFTPELEIIFYEI